MQAPPEVRDDERRSPKAGNAARRKNNNKGQQERMKGKQESDLARATGGAPHYNERKGVGLTTTITNAVMLLLCPPLVNYCQNSCRLYKCSLTGPLQDLYDGNLSLSDFAYDILLPPLPSLTAIGIYAFWVAFQAFLMLALPSKLWQGKKLPSGRVLDYKCVNGLLAWVITHALFVGLALLPTLFHLPYRPVFSPSIIYDYFLEILAIVQVIGLVGSAAFYLKARLWPTPDTRFTSNWLFDYFMGTELNPRFYDSKIFDIKLFINGRPGIVAWTLINLSFAAKQYELYGTITNSMILLNILQAIYVCDFFYNEAWYLGTIDIMHDRMGFYLCWGSFVWLPFMYTLQGHFLVENPIQLSPNEFFVILVLGVAGYLIFRSANNQKDYFRRTQGKKPIWGKNPKFLRAEYTTNGGQKHQTMLLASGWWGISRHFNYVGDLMMCLAFCLCAQGLPEMIPGRGEFVPVQGQFNAPERPGFHLLACFYFIYMAILLVHRSMRDDERCAAKYGAKWAEYQKLVPWKILPYVY